MAVQKPNWLLRFVNPKNGVLDSHAMRTLTDMATQANTNADDITTNTTAIAALPFQKSFTSSQQVITAAGALTLAHSLGTTPILIQARLVNLTAESGYSINDEVVVNPGLNTSAAACGLSIVPDTANLNIRFASNATTFNIVHKTTGAVVATTNANWKIVFRAWA